MTMNKAIIPDSVSAFASILVRARLQQLPLGELVQVAESMAASGLKTHAAELYKIWIAFNDSDPLVHVACFNYSVVLSNTGDVTGAIHILRACLRHRPDFGPAHVNLGRALEDSGLFKDAIEQWQDYVGQTADITPDRLGYRLMNLQQIGRLMEQQGLMEGAESVLRMAIELQPDKFEAGQHWVSLRQRQCKWPVLVPSTYVSKRQLLESMSSMTLSCYADDPLFQLARAWSYSRQKISRPETNEHSRRQARQRTGTGQRLKVGYVSSDLRDHAVGFALVEVLELHDRNNIEIFAYYCGPAREGDATQNRIRDAVDKWHDINGLSDATAAALIAADEIDILIDVNGYTKMARTGVFAYRPAPVIVNFCGYPGSTGSPYHQYMIADDVIVPAGNEIYYSEKVLKIPCNQPVDRKRVVAEKPSRQSVGLPETGFVYACFNGMQKITAEGFARWITILSANPDSVLWILAGDSEANTRLKQAAAAAGIAPERIILAEKAGNPQHLARIGLADLFLDTFPYGAHSTASDAITMGLPVLTVPGKTFASRFCASIVSAAGIPELICDSPEDYVRKAILFGRERKTLEAIRKTIQLKRDTCALRDMPALARRLEELFWQMQGEAERGETPVPDLRNMDVYYDIGTELVLEASEFESDDDYRQRYRDRLAERNDHSPLVRDTRLWTGPSAYDS